MIKGLISELSERAMTFCCVVPLLFALDFLGSVKAAYNTAVSRLFFRGDYE